MDLTHASFFSGVGGLDMGLERAGWRTVSFSEIDPYASAVLAERWPGVPNLGDITRLRPEPAGRVADLGRGDAVDDGWREAGGGLFSGAYLWTGGFPCQDLSVAGKRRGFGNAADRARAESARQRGRSDAGAGADRERSEPSGGRWRIEPGSDGLYPGLLDGESLDDADQRIGDTRSGLAFAFLDLVGRHRPPAVLLENVPGLLSSHGGRDLGALLGTLGQLGYWWAYRVLDARHFGVPQRRRRVFILALDAERHPDPDCAAAVLAVGSRCDRHPAAGIEAGSGAAERAVPGIDIARAVTGTSGKHHDDDTDTLIAAVAPGAKGWRGMRGDGADPIVLGASPDPGGVRAPDELAGRAHDRVELAATLNSGGNDGGFRTEPGEPIIVSPTLRVGPARPQDGGPGDTVPIVVSETGKGWWSEGVSSLRSQGGGTPAQMASGQFAEVDDPLLPLGLDSHRYRCCGNGVVSSVSEWIGMRLRDYVSPGYPSSSTTNSTTTPATAPQR